VFSPELFAVGDGLGAGVAGVVGFKGTDGLLGAIGEGDGVGVALLLDGATDCGAPCVDVEGAAFVSGIPSGVSILELGKAFSTQVFKSSMSIGSPVWVYRARITELQYA
jgi:hypothetical protein